MKGESNKHKKLIFKYIYHSYDWREKYINTATASILQQLKKHFFTQTGVLMVTFVYYGFPKPHI